MKMTLSGVREFLGQEFMKRSRQSVVQYSGVLPLQHGHLVVGEEREVWRAQYQRGRWKWRNPMHERQCQGTAWWTAKVSYDATGQ